MSNYGCGVLCIFCSLLNTYQLFRESGYLYYSHFPFRWSSKRSGNLTKDWLLRVGESHFEIWQADRPSSSQARTQSWVQTEQKVVKRHQPLLPGSRVTSGIRTAVASTLKTAFHHRPHNLQGLAIRGVQGSVVTTSQTECSWRKLAQEPGAVN